MRQDSHSDGDELSHPPNRRRFQSEGRNTGKTSNDYESPRRKSVASRSLLEVQKNFTLTDLRSTESSLKRRFFIGCNRKSLGTSRILLTWHKQILELEFGAKVWRVAGATSRSNSAVASFSNDWRGLSGLRRWQRESLIEILPMNPHLESKLGAKSPTRTLPNPWQWRSIFLILDTSTYICSA